MARHSFFLAASLALAPPTLAEIPDEALAVARQAVDRRPQVSAYRQALAMVHLQAEQWDEARAVAEKATELRGEEDGADALVLAIAHAQLENAQPARDAYARAAAWIRKQAAHPYLANDPLLRIAPSWPGDAEGRSRSSPSPHGGSGFAHVCTHQGPAG